LRRWRRKASSKGRICGKKAQHPFSNKDQAHVIW